MRYALCVLLLLSVGACGGGVRARDDATVRVGAIISRTGLYAALGDDMERAIRLYLEERGGELGGRRAELIVADDAGSQETGRRRAGQLIVERRVDVLTGLVAAPVADAVVQEASARGVPVVIANAGADALGGPGVFRVSSTDYAHGYAAGTYAAKAYGRAGAVLMAADHAAGVETLSGFADGYARAGGAAPVKVIRTPFGKTQNFRRYLGDIPEKARFLYACYAGGEAITFVQDFRRLGYPAKVRLLACQNLTDEDVLRATGAEAAGVTSVGLYSPALDNPENAVFVARWRARTGGNPSAVAAQSWDAMRLIDRAAAAGGDLTAALAGVSELASPRGGLRLDERHQPVQDWYVRRYEGGVNRVIATVAPG